MKLKYFSATRSLSHSGERQQGGMAPVMSLLRPFLDLEGPGMSISARACHQSGRKLLDDSPDLPPQGHTRAAFRRMLVAESGLPEYAAAHPAELPTSLRGPAWQRLVDDLAGWDGLPNHRRLKVVTALNKLTFNATILAMLPPYSAEEVAADDLVALLALKRASALSKELRPLSEVEGALALVARNAPAGGHARLGAAINLTVHHARVSRDTSATQQWAAVVTQEMGRLRVQDSAVDRLRASAALRAASFGPFVRKERETVSAMLAEAGAYARTLFDESDIPRVLAEENLYALLETRTNEARWLGDRDRSYAHLADMVELDPFEPKTRLQLGDMYWDDGRIEEAATSFAAAAMLGVPSTAVAWFCVGRCRERLGDPGAALDAYQESIAVDPFGMSSLVRLRRLAIDLGESALASWATDRLNALHRRGADHVRSGGRSHPAAITAAER